MKRNKSIVRLFVIIFAIISIVSGVFAINAGEAAPKMENPTRISNRGVDKVALYGMYKWIKKDTGKWSLNLDISNPYLFASNCFVDVVTIKDNGQPDVAIYCFDEVGSVITGWAKDDDGNYYFFDYEDGPSIGRMCFGWRKIGDAWYYFGFDGKLYVNQMTPDGFKVGIDGNVVGINNNASRYTKKYGAQ